MVSSNQGPSEVSLEKHLKLLNKDNEVGPPVHDNIATYVEGVWNSINKDELRPLYDISRRPQNTPSLQKVDLDEELMTNLSSSRKPKDIAIKKADLQLRHIHTAFVKAATSMAQMADLAYSAPKDQDVRQTMLDKSCEVIRILAYGASQVHPIRRNNIKPRLIQPLRQRLDKTSLQATNNSHFLFGGDLHKQAKDGEFHFYVSFHISNTSLTLGINAVTWQ